MTRRGERAVARGLWAVYGVLALAGLGILSEALFVRREPRPVRLEAAAASPTLELKPMLSPELEALANRKMTRAVAARPAAPVVAAASPVPLESLLKLTGILDFGGKSPSVAVIETPTEAKGYRSGDSIGETGAVVRTVADYVVLEFEKRRYKLTFKGIEELPAGALGEAGGRP